MFGIEPSEGYTEVCWQTRSQSGESYDLRAETQRQMEHCLWQVLCSLQTQGTRRALWLLLKGPRLSWADCQSKGAGEKWTASSFHHHRNDAIKIETNMLVKALLQDALSVELGFYQSDFMQNPEWLYNCFNVGSLWMFIRNRRENAFSRETMALITRSTACRYGWPQNWELTCVLVLLRRDGEWWSVKVHAICK